MNISESLFTSFEDHFQASLIISKNCLVLKTKPPCVVSKPLIHKALRGPWTNFVRCSCIRWKWFQIPDRLNKRAVWLNIIWDSLTRGVHSCFFNLFDGFFNRHSTNVKQKKFPHKFPFKEGMKEINQTYKLF